MSALTSKALKNVSIASKGATSVLETLVRTIWICESKREGLLTSQSKVMVQNVSERSFFTFHYHFEGNFDVDKNEQLSVFDATLFFHDALKNYLLIQSSWCGYSKCSLSVALYTRKKIRVIESLDKKISTRIKKSAHKERFAPYCFMSSHIYLYTSYRARSFSVFQSVF